MFIANQRGTAFLKCGEIKDEAEFYTVSPYSPSGSKSSARLFRLELGQLQSSQSQTKADAPKDGKTYYGDKQYFNSRIAYNRCAMRDAKKTIPNKYGDVASPYEAFLQGLKLFRRGSPLLPQGQSSSSIQGQVVSGQNPPQNLLPFPGTSQLIDAEDYAHLSSSAADNASSGRVSVATLSEGKESKRQHTSASASCPNCVGQVEVDEKDGGKRYVAYPNSNVYFACPALDPPSSTSLPSLSEQWLQWKQKHPLNYSDANANGSMIYCGNELDTLLRARMCGSLQSFDSEQSGKLGQFEGLDALTLGTTGQCFQFGKALSISRSRTNMLPPSSAAVTTTSTSASDRLPGQFSRYVHD